jgi:oxygen-independent coproporphyrinogen-3 oxidase
VSSPDPFALYLHIPFCAARCPYCDFNTYAGLESLFEPYTAALVEEVRRAGASRSRPPVRTVFIGGGTPTVLPPALLEEILDACREAFDVSRNAEISSEANPGTVDQARFVALRDLGINRLSLGVQSFEDAELRWLGRIHSAAEAEAAFAAARTAGFRNINLDFIFGVPGQSLDTWARTLAHAIALGPEHLSLYALTVEPDTPLAAQVHSGRVDEPDDDLAADLYLAASDALATAGYVQYEISNWARNDQRPASALGPLHGSLACYHNLVYWHNEPYLGFGAGAHSYDGERRWWNVSRVPAYVQRIQAGNPPEAGGETIERRLAMGETMMLGLRLVQEGVTGARFRERFGLALDDVFAEQITKLVASGLLERLPDRVRLTSRGRLLGNQVFAEFL